MVLVIASRGLTVSGGEHGRAPLAAHDEFDPPPLGTADPDGPPRPDAAFAAPQDAVPAEAPPLVARRRDDDPYDPRDLERFVRLDRAEPSLGGPVPETPETLWATEPRRRRKWPVVLPLAALGLVAGVWLAGSPPEPAFRPDQIDPPAIPAPAADSAPPPAHEEPAAREQQAAHEEPAAREPEPARQEPGAEDHAMIAAPSPLPPAPAAIPELPAAPAALPEPPASPPSPEPASTAEAPAPPAAKPPSAATPDAAPPPATQPASVNEAAPSVEVAAPSVKVAAPSRRRAAPAAARSEPPLRRQPLHAKDGPPIDAADLPPLDPAGTPTSEVR